MAELARTPWQLGSVIRRYRRSSGLTQAQLGTNAGVRQETISSIETSATATRSRRGAGRYATTRVDVV